MTAIIVRVDTAEARQLLQQAPQRLRAAVLRWLPRVGQHAKGRMQHWIQRTQSQNATGQLAGSVQVRVEGDHVVVGPTKRTEDGRDLGLIANYPTRAHRIEPRDPEGALTIPSHPGGHIGLRGGFPVTVVKLGLNPRSGRERVAVRGVLFRKSVQHPGTSGLHFLENTETDLLQSNAAQRMLDEEVRRELGGE